MEDWGGFFEKGGLGCGNIGLIVKGTGNGNVGWDIAE
jgi:hypothetical protein